MAALCTRLRTEPFVTVDTEFMRERTYYPELCVVQLGRRAGRNAVIDTMAAGLDLAPLGELLRDEAVMKVFHAARQDVEIFLELFGAVPKPLFDTQVAAMVAGFGDQVGYDALVAALTGGQIDKAHRFSDWSARPLSPAQVTYAAADVTHLHTAYSRLRERLERDGRSEWVEEEMQVLCRAETYRADPEAMWERLRPRTRQPPHAGRVARRRGLAGAGGTAGEHPPSAPDARREPVGGRRHRPCHSRGAGPVPWRHARLRRGAERDRAARRDRGRRRVARGRAAGSAPRT